jgi:hypothetical protein
MDKQRVFKHPIQLREYWRIRKQVIDVLESGKKIGTWILKVSPEGKLAKNKVVKFFATHYVNIDLFIA